jgi:hypothetical protein
MLFIKTFLKQRISQSEIERIRGQVRAICPAGDGSAGLADLFAMVGANRLDRPLTQDALKEMLTPEEQPHEGSSARRLHSS